MIETSVFDQALDAVEKLPNDQQVEIADIIRNRVRERRREELVASVHEAEAEYARGDLKPMSVDEIMRRSIE